MVHFELAAEVRDLLEAQLKGDFLDRSAGQEKPPRGHNPLFIEPVLGRPLHVTVKLALELPRRHLKQPGQFPGVVSGTDGCFPGWLWRVFGHADGLIRIFELARNLMFPSYKINVL